ncbi:MAG: sel1 repeat family protein [Gammaproteobacteria bacterium]|nr:sel1 repeat family protein [Gammaproteobacteria bacterium]
MLPQRLVTAGVGVFGLLILIAACISNADTPSDKRWALCRSIPPDPNKPSPDGIGPSDQLFRRINACESLLKGNKDPDLHFYIGRLSYSLGMDKKAIEQLRLGRNAGSAKATTALAWMVESNDLSAKEAGGEFRALYEEAAARGDPIAQVRLAHIIRANSENPIDRVRAIALLEKAAAQGDVEANYWLGWHYSHFAEGPDGNFEPADKVRALQHYERSARGGFERAVDELKRLGKDVSGYRVLSEREIPDAIFRP